MRRAFSIYFDPNELTRIGDQIGSQWARALEIFAACPRVYVWEPLLDLSSNSNQFDVDSYVPGREELFGRFDNTELALQLATES